MRAGLLVLAVCGLPVLLSALMPAWAGEELTVQPNAFTQKPVLLGAHRSGRDMWPENTVFGYQSALAKWPDALLEGDVLLTADKQVVVLHNETVDATTNGTGRVADLTLAQVKALDAGYRFTRDGGKTFPFRGKGITIPLFSEVLAAAPDSRFLIEMKNQPGLAAPTVQVLREANALSRVALASFNIDLMRQAREIEPRLLACYDVPSGMEMLIRLRGGDWANYRPAAAMLALEKSMVRNMSLTTDELKAIRDKGICTLVFTVNAREQMTQFLDMGFSCVLTDNPQDLAEILAHRNGTTP